MAGGSANNGEGAGVPGGRAALPGADGGRTVPGTSLPARPRPEKSPQQFRFRVAGRGNSDRAPKRRGRQLPGNVAALCPKPRWHPVRGVLG